MRESDAVTMQILRKHAEADLDAETWSLIEKQAAEVGVRGLTGTARALVEGLVRKHGGSSHSQSSHGNWAGGGRSGGSNSNTGKGEDKGKGGKPTVRQMQSAATFLDNEGDVPSEAFAPTGIGNMGESQAQAMIAHARKLGWKEED